MSSVTQETTKYFGIMSLMREEIMKLDLKMFNNVKIY